MVKEEANRDKQKLWKEVRQTRDFKMTSEI